MKSYLFLLSYRDMEATLLHFVFHIASSFFTFVTQHFTEHPLQCIIPHGLDNWMIAVVTNIESGAKKMTRTFRSILVVALQTLYVFHRT